MSERSYKVRVRDLEARRGASGKIVSYRVRWTVAGKLWRKTFATKSQANAYRASLFTAIKNGEAFDTGTGLPLSAAPRADTLTWYEFTLTYTTVKWPTVSPGSRRGIAEALTDGTEALTTKANRQPSRDDLRAALRWAYSIRIRDDPEPPAQLQPAIDWLSAHTVQMDAFKEPATRSKLVRDLMARITHTKTGAKAAAATATRKRMILHNAMEYACETGLLTENPLDQTPQRQPASTHG